MPYPMTWNRANKQQSKMSTNNQLDLETLGSQPIMLKILPRHWDIVYTTLNLAILRMVGGGVLLWRKGNYIYIRPYLSFIQHKSPKVVCRLEDIIFYWFDTGFYFKDPGLIKSRSFEMNWPQTYRGLSFYVGWMRGTFMCDNSLCPLNVIRQCASLDSFKVCQHACIILSQ